MRRFYRACARPASAAREGQRRGGSGAPRSGGGVAQLEAAAVVLDEAAGHGEAEAGAALLAEGDEGLEDAVADLGRDARALVGEHEHEDARRARPRR